MSICHLFKSLSVSIGTLVYMRVILINADDLNYLLFFSVERELMMINCSLHFRQFHDFELI